MYKRRQGDFANDDTLAYVRIFQLQKVNIYVTERWCVLKHKSKAKGFSLLRRTKSKQIEIMFTDHKLLIKEGSTFERVVFLTVASFQHKEMRLVSDRLIRIVNICKFADRINMKDVCRWFTVTYINILILYLLYINENVPEKKGFLSFTYN